MLPLMVYVSGHMLPRTLASMPAVDAETTGDSEFYPHGMKSLTPEHRMADTLKRLGSIRTEPMGSSRFIKTQSILFQLDGKDLERFQYGCQICENSSLKYSDSETRRCGVPDTLLQPFVAEWEAVRIQLNSKASYSPCVILIVMEPSSITNASPESHAASRCTLSLAAGTPVPLPNARSICGCGGSGTTPHAAHSHYLPPAGKERRWDMVGSMPSVGSILYHREMHAVLLVRQFRPPVRSLPTCPPVTDLKIQDNKSIYFFFSNLGCRHFNKTRSYV